MNIRTPFSFMAVLAYLAFAVTASGEQPWEVLPPTAMLPKDTVGQHAKINGANIWYAEWGKSNPGTPVLLLHGGYGNSNYFGNLVPELVRQGYHVIAMDSRGHGRSTRTPDPYTYHLMADDVVSLLNRLKIKQVSLVGWSDGGCIGYDLVLNHPERLARLFAFGANADISGINQHFDTAPAFAAYIKRVPVEYHDLSPTPNDWDSFNAAVAKMWDTLPDFTAQQLRSFKVSTTIADGQYDEAINPVHLRYVAATIPGANLVILPKVSHFAMLQNPTLFNAAVVSFLQH